MFTTMQIASGVLIGASVVFWLGLWYVRKFMLPKKALLVDTMMMSSVLQGLCRLATGGDIDLCTVIAVTNGDGNPAIGKTMRTIAYGASRPDVMPQSQGLEMDTDYVVTLVEAMVGRKEYVVADMKWGLLRAICEDQKLRCIAIQILHTTDYMMLYVVFGSHEEKTLSGALHEMSEATSSMKRAIKNVL